MSRQLPARGDIWTIDLRTGRGSEQGGNRPALVIQNDIGNFHASTTIIAAITTTTRVFPVTVPLEKGEGGVRRKSMVNLSQILTVDQSRLKKKLGKLSSTRMSQVDEAARISLALS